MIPPILKIDEQLSLLPPHPSLTDQLFKLIEEQRSYLSYWLPWVTQLKTQTDVRHWLYDAERFNIGGQHFNTFIYLHGEIVGSTALMRINRKHLRAELGYWLAKTSQGQGVMTCCCRVLIAHSFRQLKLNRLEIQSPKQNARSRAMALRLGFQSEGLLKQHIQLREQFLDTEIFGLVYSDWKKTVKP